jgi:hypothetical protein
MPDYSNIFIYGILSGEDAKINTADLIFKGKKV